MIIMQEFMPGEQHCLHNEKTLKTAARESSHWLKKSSFQKLHARIAYH